jgi:phospholipid transport system transporter-binding protein
MNEAVNAAAHAAAVRREESRLVLSGPVTLGNVTQMLEEGRRHLADGAATVDLGEVKEVDSSALALLLAWLREAKAAGRSLVFANLPESLQTIARLYGVQDLLPVAR